VSRYCVTSVEVLLVLVAEVVQPFGRRNRDHHGPIGLGPTYSSLGVGTWVEICTRSKRGGLDARASRRSSGIGVRQKLRNLPRAALSTLQSKVQQQQPSLVSAYGSSYVDDRRKTRYPSCEIKKKESGKNEYPVLTWVLSLYSVT